MNERRTIVIPSGTPRGISTHRSVEILRGVPLRMTVIGETMKSRYRYAVVYEREGRSYGAYVPDLPGCVAVASSLKTLRKLIREAIALHVDDMTRRGQRLPRPSAEVDYIEAKPAA